MLKYPCLVFDHDDTVVQTERAIGYPYFHAYLQKIRPGTTLSFSEYVHYCNNTVFADMCKERWGFTDAELKEEYLGWKAYSRLHTPPIFLGIDGIIKEHKARGGILCVSSLSTREIIERDYLHHLGFLPDAVYDYDLPTALRKPNPYALTDIMERFQLQPEEILMIDDMKLGWEMACKVNVPTAFAGWSKAEFPELAQQMRSVCSYSFDSVVKLAHFLFD